MIKACPTCGPVSPDSLVGATDLHCRRCGAEFDVFADWVEYTLSLPATPLPKPAATARKLFTRSTPTRIRRDRWDPKTASSRK